MSDGGEFRTALQQPLGPNRPLGKRFLDVIDRHETLAFSAVSLGDLAYDVARLRFSDAQAVEAFDFAQRADLSDLHRLAAWATDIRDLPAAAEAGNVNRLQGYVFERLVAIFLREQGAEVSFPSTSNNPGADLLVNGRWVQVKCGLSPSLVQDHFRKFPDVPAIVNEELAAAFSGDPRVIVASGISREMARNATERALDDAAEVLDFEVLPMASVIVAARAVVALVRGSTDIVGAGRALALDAAGRAAGAALGKAAAAGVIAAGVLSGWAAILLPLAASSMGYRVGRGLTAPLKERLFCRNEAAELRRAISAFCRAAVELIGASVAHASGQALLFRRAHATAAPEWKAVLEDWLNRLEQEQGLRKHLQQRLLRGADDSMELAVGGGALSAAETALRLAALAGLLPTDAPAPLTQLEAAAGSFSRAMRRHLLTPS